jgi:hypothetical protein
MILAAVCDRLQVSKAYIVTLETTGLEMLVAVGGSQGFNEVETVSLFETISKNGFNSDLLTLDGYWIVPLFEQSEPRSQLLGILGIERPASRMLDDEQYEALISLAEKSALALEDRMRQQQVFSSLKSLAPQVDLIQKLRASARYDGSEILAGSDRLNGQSDLIIWVKDALNHYWGGPKLTSSPLIQLQVVQSALQEHQGNPANALRAILRQAVNQVRPEGERRFTAEWILYNILELKFMEGRKVREVAMRLAMSEADLYRKQRVAIEAVAKAILGMEEKLVQQEAEPEN